MLLETEEPMQEQLSSRSAGEWNNHGLCPMEIAGIKVERKPYGHAGGKWRQLRSRPKKIYDLAGQEFNINSPKQLRTILFEDNETPYQVRQRPRRATRRRWMCWAFSTIAPIVSKILEYRQISKLQSYINIDAGRR